MKRIFIAIALICVPGVAFAQSSSLTDLISFILNDIFARGLIPLLILASLAAFFWGLVKFIYRSSDNPQSIAEGKWFMFWGVVALFVMTSLWGITAIIGDTFGIRSVVPQLSTGGSGSYTNPNTGN